MKAEELRIGNLVLHSNGISKVNMIRGNDIGLYDLGLALWGTTIDRIEPIPLTEEWLLKFGFHDRSGQLANRMGYGIDVNSIIEIAWYKQGNDVRLQTKGSGYTLNTGIAYVHQLQNLYFALTGNELTIKP